MDTLALKIYDATLWLYERLCTKDCGRGGLTEDEYGQMKDLFMSLTQQAKDLLRNFYVRECGRRTDDYEAVIDYAVEMGIIYYPGRWKTMYNGLRRRIEKGRMVRNDRTRNLHSPRYLLPTLNRHLAACYWTEKETGKTYTESPELFRSICNYISSDAPLVNEYPGISLKEQALISEQAYMNNIGELADYKCEFIRRMKWLMEERGLAFFLAPTWQIECKGHLGERSSRMKLNERSFSLCKKMGKQSSSIILSKTIIVVHRMLELLPSDFVTVMTIGR